MAKKFHDLNWRAKAHNAQGETIDILETDSAGTLFEMILQNSEKTPKTWTVFTDKGRMIQVNVS